MSALRPASLQARLLILVMAASGLLIAGAFWRGYDQALGEADDVFDAQLMRSAQVLLAVNGTLEDDVIDPVSNQGRREDGDHHRYELQEVYRVWWRDDGRWQAQFASPGQPPLPALDRLPLGYSDHPDLGIGYRLLLRRNRDDTRRVVVAQPLQGRLHVAREVAWHSLQPFMVGMPVLLLLLALLIHRTLRPLRELVGQLAERDASRLDPVVAIAPPTELKPVVAALNELLARVDTALSHERRFTDNAAHELRTPLAALAAQLQVAQRGQGTVAGDQALDKARQGAARMAHLVDQLLQLARVEGSEMEALAPCDLAVLVQGVCAGLGAQALAHTQSLELEAASGVDFHCPAQADWMAILLRNLIDNALRYTPAGGRVLVSLRATDVGVRLTVADNGPGVEEAQRLRLGERFRRLSSGVADGVGLGLSIAARIAERHRTHLEFDHGLDGRGLSVSVLIPR